MDQLSQVVVSGLMTGGLFGLISSGLALSFGITRVVNFAHGDFVTVGMFVGVLLSGLVGAGFLLLLPILAVVAGAAGMVVYVLLLSRTSRGAVREEDGHMPQIVITVGVSAILQGLLLMIFGPGERTAHGLLSSTLKFFGLYIPAAQLMAFLVACVAFAALHVAVTRTDFGRGLRAIVDDADAAAMSGVNPRRLFALSFGVGVGLACLAGGLLATYLVVTPLSGSAYLAIAFVTVVIGGLGSVTGAFLGGLLVGVVQQASATYVAADLQNVALWIVFIVMLLMRPSGILGRRVIA